MHGTRLTAPLVVGAFAFAFWLEATPSAMALPAFMRQFQQAYGWKDATCIVCHTTRAGGGTHNPYGLAFKNNGMNKAAFNTIANFDSDGDGIPNLVEIRARAYPGDASSVPAKGAEKSTETPSEQEEGAFDLNAQSVGEEGGTNVGPLSDLTLGGAFDLRYGLPGTTLLPGDGGKSGTMYIHVAEFVVTANIGENISILSEQLLLTGKTETTVADDHGFVYAIIRNLPVLPSSVSLKTGRFRHAFGADAFLDAAANPLYTLVIKNLGFVSDKGIQFAGFLGPVNYTLSAALGPDTLRSEEATAPAGGHGTEGHGSGGGGGLTPIENNSKPVFLRVFGEIRPVRLRLGGSFFDGNSFRLTGDGVLDDTRLVYKRRVAADAQWRFGRLTLSGEYSRGFDRPPMEYIGGEGALAREVTTEGVFARADLPLTASTDLSVKFDAYNPNTDFYSLTERDAKAPLTTMGGAFTWHPQEAVVVRVVYQANNFTRAQPTGLLTTQLLVEY